MVKENKSDVIKKIKLAMLEHGFTQTTLAKKMGKTQGAINKWLNGRSAITMKSLEEISKLTGKPLNYFFDNSTDVKAGNMIIGDNNALSGAAEVDFLKGKILLLEKEVEVHRNVLENLQLKLELMQNKQNKK